MNKDLLLSKIRQGADMTRREQIVLAAMLSVPAMLAQLVQIVMEYIDAAMVGSLGAEASASIGLVSSTIWLFGGLCHAFAAGFSVQVAHQIGANRFEEARHILRQSLLCAVLFSVTLAAIGVGIARQLPHWLGGSADICHDATIYFAISAAMLPFMTLMALSAGMLRSAGNVKVPSVMMATACLLDVIFNWIFIFRMGWGVFGAAFGPVIMLSLFWKRFNFQGAVAGILVGAVVDILWLAFLSGTGVYEIIPGFACGLIAALAVSYLTPAPGKDVEALFDRGVAASRE